MDPFIPEDLARLKDELEHLAERKHGYAVSLYAPMHRAGADTRENAIRFKNRVQEAEQMLETHELGPRDIAALLGPAKALFDDDPFWQHQADGFAMFLTDEHSHAYRLQEDFGPLTVVADRFHLKPLLPLLSGDGTFYVLAASINKARLFEATRQGISEVDLPGDVPRSMDYATRFDDPEKSSQQHSSSGSKPGGARPDAVYHGTGAGDTDKKELILRYFKLLENGVTDYLADKTAPLLFMGVKYLFPLYREANHYHYLLDETVTGNPDDWDEDAIHTRAWEVVAPHFDQQKEDAVQQYRAVAHTDNSSADLKDIVTSAVDARVDTLIVGMGEQVWGNYDRDARELELAEAKAPGTEDLLDFAAVQTLMNGGKVYAVPAGQVPDGGSAVAIYRF